MLIFVLIVGIIDGPKAAVSLPFATEAHKALCAPFVFVANLAHHVDFPSASFESTHFNVGAVRRRLHDNSISDWSGARFANVQCLVR